MGLGSLGIGDKDKAKEYFGKVLIMENTHQNAGIYLKEC